MPIMLDEIEKQVAQGITPNMPDPKKFNKSLTGSGKKVGVLCETTNPVYVLPNKATPPESITATKRSYQNGTTVVDIIPLNPMEAHWLNMMDKYAMPDPQDWTLISDNASSVEVHAAMYAHSLILETTSKPEDGKDRALTACYQLMVRISQPGAAVTKGELTGHATTKDAQSFATRILNMAKQVKSTLPSTPDHALISSLTANPQAALNELMKQTAMYVNIKIDAKRVQDFMENQSLYSMVCDRYTDWMDNMPTIMKSVIEYMADTLTNIRKNNTGTSSSEITFMHYALKQIAYLESYPIPLDCYRAIYNEMAAKLTPKDTAVLCKQNLNLLLSDTMESLKNNKGNLQKIPPADQNSPIRAKCSIEQWNAINCTDPLVLVQAGAGTGKCQPLSEPVLTPTGWTTMGELKVGDDIIGSDGKTHKVLRIHEKGLRAGYHLTFRDGSATDVCGEHVWTVCNQSRTGEQRRTLTTEEWLNSGYKTHGYLPMIQPVEYEFGEKDLPLDPYFLGALLADGMLGSKGRIEYRKSNMDVVSKVKESAAKNGYVMQDATEINATAKRWKFTHADDIHRRIGMLKATIRDLGINVKSREKFIPDIYKTASIQQRKALLNGLFDGDGDIRTGRQYARFNTASDQMAEDVLQMLWSLGLSATKQKQKHKNGDYWSVNLLDQSWDPFIASEYRGKAKGSVRSMRRSLVSAEPFDPVPMRCIEVDAPDKLYVTKDYIVTHNSTTLLHRIELMTESGVDPEDITVLSFTNAAANHITDICPNVHSMTIANMIHQIYSLNYASHRLSNIGTMINSLDIAFPKNQLAIDFKKLLRQIDHNDDSAFTKMNNFVEDHFNEVISFMNRIGQTCLEMEIIVCYQKIGTLQEPKEIQSKHLIIDEVQDNSIFEFVYALKYVDKHLESLFIVGDCSQTLYEFRASNPKALNMLEGSGVFKTFQLQVNYRSNQEILDFANVALNRIEANQYAHIQLRANSLAPVTEQSFISKVNFHYKQLNKLAEFEDAFGPLVATTLKPYMDKCLAANEQVAFLSYTRRDAMQMQSILQTMYPNTSIVSIVPERIYNNTIFSDFIHRSWDKVRFVPSKDIAPIIVSMIMQELPFLVVDAEKVKNQTQQMCNRWVNENLNTIRGWQKQVVTRHMPLAQMMDMIRDNMIEFEINNNNVKQALISSRNEETKNAEKVKNANFILSTIHSAKGLEFNNVIVLYKHTDTMTEADKRMYYVALTRAMKTEFVLAYGSKPAPQIEDDYNTIIEILRRKTSNVIMPQEEKQISISLSEIVEQTQRRAAEVNKMQAAKKAKAEARLKKNTKDDD